MEIAETEISPARAWAQVRRVLCVRLDGLGDLLMSTPALRALKRHQPDMQLTVLTSPAGARAAALIAEIDEIIVHEAPWMKAAPAGPTLPAKELQLIEHLRQRQFDGAIIFTVYSQTALPAALYACLAGIPLRLAYCRENPYQLLSHWQREREPQSVVRHEVNRQLDLVASIGVQACGPHLSLQPALADSQWAAHWLRQHGLQAERALRWLLLHPGASAPSRRYPLELWQQVVRQLAHEDGLTIVLAGETELDCELQQLQSVAPTQCLRLPGTLRLGQLAALIARAPLLLCNNSGPAHIAAAMSTPVVVLYALTNPQHTPWQVPSRVLYATVDCHYCYRSICPQLHHQCLRGVEPQRVVDAARELLAGLSRPGPQAPEQPLPGMQVAQILPWSEGPELCGACAS